MNRQYAPPNFARDHTVGQLYDEERVALYQHILASMPQNVFEIGTWRGGGSTYFISSALAVNDYGHLWTFEINPGHYGRAVELYTTGELKHLRRFISFNLGDSLVLIPPIAKNAQPMDFVLIDGGPDHEEASAIQQMNELEMVRPFLVKDSVVAIHDWGLGKTSKTEPHLLDSDEFMFFSLIHTLAFFRKV
ncbi:MAG: class I SAM-dependent methyltransferase [bacterium]